MFTGIIQGQGEILALRDSGTERRFTLRPLFSLPSIVDGESIAVNGACLSVETHSEGVFTAYASAETLSRTTLGKLKGGDMVNMERALAMGDRLGGHLVSGHVDCLATVRSVTGAGQSLCCRLAFPKEFGVEVIAKGSVALDGISLTVAAVTESDFTVSLIPHTREVTNLREKKAGSILNIETDVIGKYVEKMMQGVYTQEGSKAVPEKSALTRAFLLENGF